MVTELVTMDDLSLDERRQLRQANAHALRRHSRCAFPTESFADEVPVAVVQKVLGHAWLQTTTIYVQAEKQRGRRGGALLCRRRPA